jgi:hypothetical protein
LAYLNAALSIKKGEGPEKAYKLLNEAVEIHFSSLKVNSLDQNKTAQSTLRFTFTIVTILFF